MPSGVPGSARCGTPSGWVRHRREGERACDACARAKAEYDARRRSADGKVRLARLRAKAQSRAGFELRHRYPEEYQELYAEALAEVFEMEELLMAGDA